MGGVLTRFMHGDGVGRALVCLLRRGLEPSDAPHPLWMLKTNAACASCRAERVDEASATLYTALRCGLEDSAVLGQLARGFSGHGRAEEVRACLEAALALPTATFGMRIALAEVREKGRGAPCSVGVLCELVGSLWCCSTCERVEAAVEGAQGRAGYEG